MQSEHAQKAQRFYAQIRLRDDAGALVQRQIAAQLAKQAKGFVALGLFEIGGALLRENIEQLPVLSTTPSIAAQRRAHDGVEAVVEMHGKSAVS